MNSVVCSRCRKQVCLSHRFEDAHDCVELAPLESAVRPGTSASAASSRTSVEPLFPATRPATAGSGSPQASSAAALLASPQQLRDLRKNLGGTSASKEACLYSLRRLLSDIARAPADPEASDHPLRAWTGVE